MTRRAAVVVLVVLAALSALLVAALSSADSPGEPARSDPWALRGHLVAATLSVTRCPTSLGAPNPTTVRLPTSLRTRVKPGRAPFLTVFTDGAGTLDVVAPRAWRCTALDAVDGSATLIVYPRGAPAPAWGEVASVRRGIVATQTGKCVGCSLETACRLFPGARHSYARTYGVACAVADGRAERTVRTSAWRVLFYDPAGVRGAGRPSGGGLPAYGAMLWHVPGTTSLTAWQETCTLPDALHDLCVVSVRDFVARHPH